jgi:hypothetical protein
MIDEACLPVVDALPSGVRLNAEIRSMSKLEEKDWQNSKRLAKYFRDGAQIIVMPFSLKDLEESSVPMKTLEKECEMLQKEEAQVMSAIFMDREYLPLLAYCASRPDRATPEVRSNFFLIIYFLNRTYYLNIKTQYNGRTEADLNALRDSGIQIRYDGLNVSCLSIP